MNPVERFWSHVDRSEGQNEKGCWLWKASIKGPKTKDGDGYGQYFWNGRNRSAHQVAWEIADGPIPAGRDVLHTCDVRRCVKREHLYLGDKFDNMRDMVRRGRQSPNSIRALVEKGHKFRPGDPTIPRGEAHYIAKLNWEKVHQIKALLAEGKLSQYKIAVLFDVSRSAILQIKLGKAWKESI